MKQIKTIPLKEQSLTLLVSLSITLFYLNSEIEIASRITNLERERSLKIQYGCIVHKKRVIAAVIICLFACLIIQAKASTVNLYS